MNKTIVLEIEAKGVKNEYPIQFPNVGKIRKIEEMKTILAPLYRDIASRSSILGNYTLDIVDMQSYLTVLCPDLIDDLKTPIDQMDAIDAKMLLSQFSKQFIPWWNKWIEVLNEPIEEIKEKQDDQQEKEEE